MGLGQGQAQQEPRAASARHGPVKGMDESHFSTGFIHSWVKPVNNL
jgi:hypothetical protein